MPWDAPEAVVDIDSTELISLGSFPDKVGLFGRRKEAAVSRIMGGRNSRSVRFVVPDGRIVDRDVTVVYMEEEREPKTSQYFLNISCMFYRTTFTQHYTIFHVC